MTFAADLRRFAAKAGRKADLVVQKVCLHATTGVVLRTPVDTGRLRQNWQATVGAPAAGTLSGHDRAGNQAVSSAQGAILAAPGKLFYLTNNLPYAAVVEFGMYAAKGPKTTADGYSAQAPAGMVRVTLAEIVRTLS